MCGSQTLKPDRMDRGRYFRRALTGIGETARDPAGSLFITCCTIMKISHSTRRLATPKLLPTAILVSTQRRQPRTFVVSIVDINIA